MGLKLFEDYYSNNFLLAYNRSSGITNPRPRPPILSHHKEATFPGLGLGSFTHLRFGVM
jgi:hypothetical protein